jgi:hypothetical protein
MCAKIVALDKLCKFMATFFIDLSFYLFAISIFGIRSARQNLAGDMPNTHW